MLLIEQDLSKLLLTLTFLCCNTYLQDRKFECNTIIGQLYKHAQTSHKKVKTYHNVSPFIFLKTVYIP